MNALEKYESDAVEQMHALIVGGVAIEMVPKTQADAAIAQLEWQRAKAAGCAGIDISELDEAWEERVSA